MASVLTKINGKKSGLTEVVFTDQMINTLIRRSSSSESFTFVNIATREQTTVKGVLPGTRRQRQRGRR